MSEHDRPRGSLQNRRTFLTTAGATGATLLAGCAGDTGSGGGTLELNVFSGQLSDSNKSAFEQYISEWEEDSDWEINMTLTPQASSVVQKERSRFEAGDPFDVMTVMGVAAFNFAANGYLATLDDFLSDSSINKGDFAPTTLINGCLDAVGPFDGNIQVIPMMIGHWGALYYNAELVEQAGYDPMSPQDYLSTPSQMLDVARDIKSETGVRPLGFSGAAHIHTPLQFYGHAWSRGDQRAMIANGEPQFTTEEALGAAELYHTMGDEDLMPEGVLSSNAIDMRNLLEENQTGMYTIGSWESALIKEESDIDFGITYVPHMQDAKPSGFGGSPMWGIAKDVETERQEASWSFLEYIMTPERQAEWSGLVPSLSDAQDLYFEGFTDGLGREVAQVFKDQISNSGWPVLTADVGTVNSITEEEVQNLIAGEKSPQEAMEDADQKVRDQILS